MTLSARHSGVLAGKWELGGAVIEVGSQPLRGGVAELTALRKAGRYVIGAGGRLVVLQMAGHAIDTDVGVVAIGMALQARDSGVRSGEWELGQIVIERGSLPAGSVVTGGTIVRKCGGHMIRVSGLGEVGEVAAGAVARNTLEMVACVAGATSQILVRPGQREMSEAGVIEVRDLPAVRVVTGFAGDGETSSAMVENAVLLKFTVMATEALRAEPNVLPDRCAPVTGIARQRRVRAEQRETIPMVLNGACVYAPTQNRMTVLALCAELALVEIGVAVRATRAGFGKDFRYVARITRYILVHAAKLEVGFGIVIEFGLGTKRRPTGGSVTILTWQRKLPMWVRYINLCYGRQRHPERYRQAA